MSAVGAVKKSRLYHRRMIGYILLGLLLIAAALALWFREDIAYTLRLLDAQIVATRFYASSPNITKNIAYGMSPDEKLDVYQPATPGPHPVLIWVHGGSWNSGSKELYAPVAQKALPHDVVVVIPGYTLYRDTGGAAPETPVGFQQARQIADVFAWTRKTISQFGGDPNRIVWGGHSAGAQLTGLVTLDPQYLAALGHSVQELCGWYGIAGPYDLDAQMAFQKKVKQNEGQLLLDVFGGEGNFARASPASFVRADLPPILLIHGDADDTVPLATSENFHKALNAAGANVELKVYPGAGHAGLLFDALAQEKPQLIEDMVKLFARCK